MDAKGVASNSSGTFNVTAATVQRPSISGIVVAEAGATKNGILDSNDALKITWAATSPNGIASQTLTVDGRAISPINGPYSGLYFSCTIGNWVAGSHSYTVHSVDAKGVASNSSGTFTVTAATNAGPTISGVVVASAKGKITWNAQDPDGVASSSLTVNGTAAKVYGPYAASSGVNYSGVFGTLPAGNYNYTIKTTDKLGNSSQHTGSFTVAANPGPAISGVVVAAAKGKMTWNAAGF